MKTAENVPKSILEAFVLVRAMTEHLDQDERNDYLDTYIDYFRKQEQPIDQPDINTKKAESKTAKKFIIDKFGKLKDGEYYFYHGADLKQLVNLLKEYSSRFGQFEQKSNLKKLEDMLNSPMTEEEKNEIRKVLNNGQFKQKDNSNIITEVEKIRKKAVEIQKEWNYPNEHYIEATGAVMVCDELLDIFCSNIPAPPQTIIMPSDSEIEKEAYDENMPVVNGKATFKYAYDDDQADAFITGAKYALSQVKAIDLRDELESFKDWFNRNSNGHIKDERVDEYLTQK